MSRQPVIVSGLWYAVYLALRLVSILHWGHAMYRDLEKLNSRDNYMLTAHYWLLFFGASAQVRLCI